MLRYAGRGFETELLRSPEAPSLARRALGKWCGAALEPAELHKAKLLASELVTNAVVHGKGRIILGAHLDEDRVLVEVADEGSGFEHEVGRRDFEDLSGRGLLIVDAESRRWGIEEGTTHVWFEIDRKRPPLGPAS